MYEILMIIYLVVALALIGFILIQQGKGAGMGSSFGGGASGTVFGASGSGNFLTKTTTILAVIFFGVALGLGNITSDKTAPQNSNDLFPADSLEQPVSTDIPAVDSSRDTDLPVASESDLPVETSETGEIPVEDNQADEDKPKDPEADK